MNTTGSIDDIYLFLGVKMNTTGSINYIYIFLVVSLVDEYIYLVMGLVDEYYILDQWITYIFSSGIR